MSFASYEELMQVVEERRQDVLTLEIDLGAVYSQEHEEAKKELANAKALKSLAGEQGFLADNVASLEARVEETRPPARSVWVQFKRLMIGEWAMLTKQANLSPVEQYEKVLPKTFVGVWGVDPVEDENRDAAPLSTDPALLSSRGDKNIVTGAMLHQVVQAFMAWQNSSGEISIRPTKSGRA